jgi:hypothetical protein
MGALVVISNNIVAYNSPTGFDDVASYGWMRHNCSWGNGDNTWQSNFCGFGTANFTNDYFFGNITLDPKFVNPGIGDYSLDSGSPCIDAGFDTAVSKPLLDVLGNTRNVNIPGIGTSVLDMGACEAQQ